MKRHRWLLRLAPALLAPVVLTACIDEISQIFSIILPSESDDPDEREAGEVLAEVRVSRDARAQVDQWLETGDEQFLDNAIELRPDDTELYGYELALAKLGGDSGQIDAAKEALTLAEARRLAALREPGDPPTAATQLRRNVLGELLVAQTRMPGGLAQRAVGPAGRRRVARTAAVVRRLLPDQDRDPAGPRGRPLVHPHTRLPVNQREPRLMHARRPGCEPGRRLRRHPRTPSDPRLRRTIRESLGDRADYPSLASSVVLPDFFSRLATRFSLRVLPAFLPERFCGDRSDIGFLRVGRRGGPAGSAGS